MASVLEIINGLAQAAANAYDGALDEEGNRVLVGLKREEGHFINDSRVMDGFGVKFVGNELCVNYHGELKLQEIYGSDLEADMEQQLSDIVGFLKKEYKKITGSSISLTPVKDKEIDVLVQKTSKVRAWVQANKYYNIGGLDGVEPIQQESEERLDKAIKNWLSLDGNKAKLKNVKGTRDLEPAKFMPWNLSKK